MAQINAYSAQLTISLLEDLTTIMSTPGSAEEGTVTEALAGTPHKIDASASDENITLGYITNPIILAIWGDEGVSFKTEVGGTALAAYPFACLCDLANGLSISEIWVSNGVASEQTFQYVAIE